MINIPVNVTITPEAPAQASARLAKLYLTAVQEAVASIQPVVDDLASIMEVHASLAEIQIVEAKLTEIEAVAADIANVNSVAGALTAVNALNAKLTELTAIYNNLADILNLNDNIAAVTAVNAALTNINSVAASLSDIETVVTNLATIQAAPQAAVDAAAAKDLAVTAKNDAVIAKDASVAAKVLSESAKTAAQAAQLASEIAAASSGAASSEADAIQLLRLHNPDLVFSGFVNTSTSTPSHTANKAYIATEGGTVLGLTGVTKGQVIKDDGTDFSAENAEINGYEDLISITTDKLSTTIFGHSGNYNIWAGGTYFRRAIATKYIGVSTKSFNGIRLPINRDAANDTGHPVFTDGIRVKVWLRGSLVKEKIISLTELAEYNATTPSVKMWYDLEFEQQTINLGDELVVAMQCIAVADLIGIVYYTSNLIDEWAGKLCSFPSSIANLTDITFTALSWFHVMFAVQIVQVLKGTDLPFSTTTITVATDGSGDFTSIRDAILSISDASETNRYIVFIKNGTYTENDLKTLTNYKGNNPDVIIVQGESKTGVIIQNDGLSTDLSPSDYSFIAQAGIAYNLISTVYKHIIYGRDSMTFRDLTLIATNAQYAAHIDNGTNTQMHIKFDNCIISATSYATIGIGITNYQKISVLNSVLKVPSSSANFAYGVYFHNTSTFANYGDAIYLSNVTCKGCGIVRYDETSGISDFNCVIENCSTDSIFGIWYNFQSGTALRCNFLIDNTKYRFFKQSLGAFLPYPKAVDFNSNKHLFAINSDTVTIYKGQPVIIDYSKTLVGYISVKKAISDVYDYVATQDILATETGLIESSIIFDLRCGADTYVEGTKLNYSGAKDVSGKFIVLVTTSIASTGMIPVKFIG